jgi:CheY-like chemotaxis protein
MLAVTDTGVGMDSETLDRIWEPFFTTKERGRGTGLGLWTVYGVVRQNGGHVRVQSEPGRGTTVQVYLPLVAGQRSDHRPAAENPHLLSGTGTVLLVEDEEMLRNLAQNVLGMSGYTVLAAEDGQRALEISRSHAGPIDLLLTDVVMPGLSGREVAERLTVERPRLRVLFMSGYTDDAIVRHGILTSEVAFLEKPFTASALTTRVRDLLQPGCPPEPDRH